MEGGLEREREVREREERGVPEVVLVSFVFGAR